jgi:small conductance mechanosensitive channel
VRHRSLPSRLAPPLLLWLGLLWVGAPQAQIGAGEDAIAAEDAVIRSRLEDRFARIQALEGVQIEVAGGVVGLHGEVQSERHQALAETLARRTQDVVEVDNALTLDTRLGARLAPVLAQAGERVVDLLAALPLLLVAGLTVGLAAWLGRWLSTRDRLFRRAARNPFLDVLLRQAVRWAALIAGILIALDLLNATALVGALLGTAGVVGLALGFAFRDVIENYIAGILMSLRQPFAPNDHVVIDGHEGKIAALTARATILITLDGNHLRLPNALVFKGVQLNYTRNPLRRFAFDVGVDSDCDLARAQRIGVVALAALPAVLDDPPPSALVAVLGDSTISIRYGGWVDQRQVSFLKVSSEAIRTVKEALDHEGVSMPAPTFRIEQAAPEDRRPAPRSPPAMDGDVAPDTHVDRQIDRERSVQGKDDLLDPDAPRE